MATEGVGAALKRAFTWHWHLLGLGSIAAFAVLTGPAAAAWVPLLVAGELAYLGFLGLNPRFQKLLRGKDLVETKAKEDPNDQLAKMLPFLVSEDRERFQQLQTRCIALLDLRRRMDAQSDDAGAENFRGESLDRLVWLFLKLLHQRSGLERFLSSTNRASMEWELSAAEEQLKKAPGGPDGRVALAVKERIETIKSRMANYDKAVENRDVVAAEIDKTEQQITHLVEVGMTTRDSASLSAKIDGISESLKSSETAFRHPDIAEILSDDEAPPLLSGYTKPVAE